MIFFLAVAIFKSLLLKMVAATVMTVKFGTIHHCSNLKENSEAEQMQNLTGHYVNYDILV